MSKRSNRSAAVKSPPKTDWFVIGGIVVIAVLVVAVLIQAGRADAPAAPSLDDLPQGIETGITAEGYPYRGSLDARVVIIEYEDLRCPFCRRHFVETEPQIMEEYVRAGLVREESRIVPILGSPSAAAAEAAACAQEQDKFWEFRHVAFANQPAESDPNRRAEFVQYAEVIGLDTTKFAACFDTQRHKGAVAAALLAAERAGISSTPTFFVNGVKVEGAIPFIGTGGSQGFKDVVDSALLIAGSP